MTLSQASPLARLAANEPRAMDISFVFGNIIRQPDAQAVVNSADANLRFGAGVTEVIHGAAGPRLEDYCEALAPLALGEALITPGFDLPNPWVIHIRAGHYLNTPKPEYYLEKALDSMMVLASANGIRALAVPAVGTGTFKFPPILAARIMARVLKRHAREGSRVEWVRVCLADRALVPLFESAYWVA
jgi:hypothetical protein